MNQNKSRLSEIDKTDKLLARKKKKGKKIDMTNIINERRRHYRFCRYFKILFFKLQCNYFNNLI